MKQDDYIEQARHIFWTGVRESRKLPPRAQAEAAHYAGGPSVDDIDAHILHRLAASGADRDQRPALLVLASPSAQSWS